MLGNLRAITFDLDNTLWDVEPVLERAERTLVEWLQKNCPRISEQVSSEEMRATREQVARDEPERAHDFNYLRTVALARHARACGYEEAVAAQAFDVFFKARNELEPFTDVRPALERLKARYVLGSLSNGNADLELIGLAELFSVSLNARQIGAAKPARRCFERLSEALQLEPQAILYAGDDPWLDVEAARAAGFRTAWINRRRVIWPSGIGEPDVTVDDCHALADALGCD